MFWKKKKSVPIKPAGVLLDIQVNLSTIGDIADGNRPLTIDDLSNLWASENSCTQTFRLAVIQQDGVVALVRHAPDRDALLRDTQLTMDLDFQVGRDRDGFVYVELIAGCLGVSLPDCSLMLVPVEHVLSILAAQPRML